MNLNQYRGQWPGILKALGVEDWILSGKHGPCPGCGGKDRFRFTDHDGAGLYVCNQCGPGNAMKLLQLTQGLDFATAAREVERVAGTLERYEPEQKDGTERLRKIGKGLVAAKHCQPVVRYLSNRGLTVTPGLKAHPRLSYFEDGKRVGRFPAMVGIVKAPDGSGVTMHVTYVDQGQKAEVRSPRKILPLAAGTSMHGAAVRLMPYTDTLGIAEGIETALAASSIFKIPVWAALSSSGLKSWTAPEGIKIRVFADNDAAFGGQEAAYALAHRLAVNGTDVEVLIPARVSDWNDVLLEERQSA